MNRKSLARSGKGNDTFAFGPDFGRDIVSDFAHGDVIEFDGGVFGTFQAVQAAMHQVGADTVISLGTDHTITREVLLPEPTRNTSFPFAPVSAWTFFFGPPPNSDSPPNAVTQAAKSGCLDAVAERLLSTANRTQLTAR